MYLNLQQFFLHLFYKIELIFHLSDVTTRVHFKL